MKSTSQMRNHVRLWLSACTVVLASAAAADTLDMQQMAASVFRVEARDSSGRLHLGSGVMVGVNTLVTNCHTLANAKEIHVTGAHARLSARIVRANSERDLCLLSVPGLKGTVATLGNTMDKQVGETIIAVGFPSGGSLTVNHGHIEGLFTYQGRGRVVQGSAYFTFGKSGGALFDERGKLIGILTFKCRAGGPFHFSVPVEWAKALIDDTADAVIAFSDKAFWQHTDERQPVFLRAASHFADGDCDAMRNLTSRWLAREPANPEAQLMAKRAQMCDLLDQIQRPRLEK